MAFSFKRIFYGISVVPTGSNTTAVTGDLQVTSGNGKLNYFNAVDPLDASSPVVTEAHTATLTNKTISGSNNTITNVPLTGDVTGTSSATVVSAIQGTTISGTTGTGNLVFATSPTLTTPSLGSSQIHNVSDPTSAQDAATKNYVDTAVAGLQPLSAVYAATTGSNIPGTYLNGVAGVGATFTTTSTATFTVDGTTPPLLSRILIKDQTSGFQNGVYQFTTAPVTSVSGAVFTRTLDYDTASDMNAAGLIPVINGTLNALTSWQQVATITTVGTDSLVFSEFTANPSLYLLKANNLSDVASKSTSFNNLSPMTTGGDIIYGGASGTGTRLANGSVGQVLTSGGGTSAPTWTTIAGSPTPPTQRIFSATGTYYTFTVSSANATQGATYTNSGQTFTVLFTIAGGTTLSTSGTGPGAGSGTLTLASGTGDATITYSVRSVGGTYFAPTSPAALYIKVTAIGGGGAGGGGGGGNGGGGGGGGGGGTVIKKFITPSGTYSFALGAGGSIGGGGAAGTPGNNTTFSTLTAGGGGGGQAGGSPSAVGLGGPGGSASGGDLNFPGNTGGAGIPGASGLANGTGGGGGGSAFAAGGGEGSTAAGNAGATNTGGGGGGSASGNNAGAGADGLILVEEFYQ